MCVCVSYICRLDEHGHDDGLLKHEKEVGAGRLARGRRGHSPDCVSSQPSTDTCFPSAAAYCDRTESTQNQCGDWFKLCELGKVAEENMRVGLCVSVFFEKAAMPRRREVYG